MIEKTDIVRGAADVDSWAGGVDLGGTKVEVAQFDQGAHQRSLAAAIANLRVVPARLHNDAGVIGSAALAHRA